MQDANYIIFVPLQLERRVGGGEKGDVRNANYVSFCSRAVCFS